MICDYTQYKIWLNGKEIAHRARCAPIHSIKCTFTIKEPEMQIDTSTTPATVTVDGKVIPCRQWSDEIREAVARKREPERPENEAWEGGYPPKHLCHHPGTMRVEGDQLVIDWGRCTLRYKREDICKREIGRSDHAKEEIAYRLAFFDRHYAPRPENEAWMAGQRSHKGTMKVEGDRLVIHWENGVDCYERHEINMYSVGHEGEIAYRLAFFDRHCEAIARNTRTQSTGMMRIEGQELVIDWEDGPQNRYSRQSVWFWGQRHEKPEGRKEWARRLAWFDKHRPLAENELRDKYGRVWQLRWHNGEKQVRGSAGVWFRHSFVFGPEDEARARAWFEANRPLRDDQVRIQGRVHDLKVSPTGVAILKFASFSLGELEHTSWIDAEARSRCLRFLANEILKVAK